MLLAKVSILRISETDSFCKVVLDHKLISSLLVSAVLVQGKSLSILEALGQSRETVCLAGLACYPAHCLLGRGGKGEDCSQVMDEGMFEPKSLQCPQSHD